MKSVSHSPAERRSSPFHLFFLLQNISTVILDLKHLQECSPYCGCPLIWRHLSTFLCFSHLKQNFPSAWHCLAPRFIPQVLLTWLSCILIASSVDCEESRPPFEVGFLCSVPSHSKHVTRFLLDSALWPVLPQSVQTCNSFVWGQMSFMSSHFLRRSFLISQTILSFMGGDF